VDTGTLQGGPERAIATLASEDGDRPTAPATRLRVGVVLAGTRVPRWQLDCLSEIDGASFCDLVVLVSDRPGERAGGNLLYRAYERADRYLFSTDDDPLEAVELPPGLTVERLAAAPSGRLDVLLFLDRPVSVPDLPTRHGAWFLQVGGPHVRRDDAPLFWETAAADGPSVMTLWAIDGTRGRALYSSYARIDSASVHRNRCVSYRRAARLPLRCLRDLHENQGQGRAAPEVAQPMSRRLGPTNWQTARFLGRLGRRVLRNRLTERLYEEQWHLAYRRRGEAEFTTIDPPPGRYFADPFLLERDGTHFLFFEDYDHATERGSISYVEIDPQGRSSAPRPALRRDYHLSYPFLHREGDDLYLVPETGSRGTVELYRARRFPDQWELEGLLIEGFEARDPTILRHDGRYWLFATTGDGIWADELHVFFSDSLLGEWTAHPMNPVVSDISRARPAGRIFERGGRLIRPSQDSSEVYGRRIVLNRIERLDETGYREVPAGRIEAVGPGGALRTHCYAVDGAYEALDCHGLRTRIPLLGGRDSPPARFSFELDG
jgi:hypothetical protein